jgi:hypothetical protein
VWCAIKHARVEVGRGISTVKAIPGLWNLDRIWSWYPNRIRKVCGSSVGILLIGPTAAVYRVRSRAAAHLPVGADADSHFGRKLVDRTSNKHPIILPKKAIFPKA